MEYEEYDRIIRHLASTIEHQRVINEDIRNFIAQQTLINERLTQLLETLQNPPANGH